MLIICFYCVNRGILMKEITYKELTELEESSFILVDTRNEGSLKYGMIPGAISITHELFETDLEGVIARLDKDKKIVLYCTRGQVSLEDAEILSDEGFDAVSLKGGYNSYLSALMEEQKSEGEAELSEKTAEIEKSIRKKFHKVLFSPFARACMFRGASPKPLPPEVANGTIVFPLKS